MFTLTKLNVLWDKVAKLEKGGTSSIPDPSAATDGQLLTVDDGEWTIADPPAGSVVITLSDDETSMSQTKRKKLLDGWLENKPVFIKTTHFPLLTSELYLVTDVFLNLDGDDIQSFIASRNVVKASPSRHGFSRIFMNTNYTLTYSDYVELEEYSTTEQDTGKKWIDGKTIYQRTVTGDLVSKKLTVDITSWNSDTIVDIEGYFTDGNGSYYMANEPVTASLYNYAHVAMINSVKTLDCYGAITSVTSAAITVYYTKATPTTNTRSKKSTKKEEETT